MLPRYLLYGVAASVRCSHEVMINRISYIVYRIVKGLTTKLQTVTIIVARRLGLVVAVCDRTSLTTYAVHCLPIYLSV